MNESLKDVVIIVPSYKPDHKLQDVIAGLLSHNFEHIVIVNDGSGSEYDSIFQKASSHEECTLLTHEVNKGKGCALKTAYTYCLEHFKDCAGVITVDGDNQHHPDDILKCARKMKQTKDTVVLGARDFSDPKVPFRSRFGNIMTRTIFRLFCGIKITDTQTGLRGTPFSHLDFMTKVAGERYEYETNVLLEMKANKIPFEEVIIQTIYIDDNDSSHFNPIVDSFKIYKTIFAFFTSSFLSSLIDLGLFYLLISILTIFSPNASWNIFIATALARLCSSFCNYQMNRRKVFKSGDSGSLGRYYLLCFVQFFASAGLVSLVSSMFPSGSFGKTIIKGIVDITLFFLSYQIQKKWVFKDRKKTESI